MEEVLVSQKEVLSNEELLELEKQCDDEEMGEELEAVPSPSCKRLGETLHHIDLALSVADEGDPDVECSPEVAQNVQAVISCYTECTQQRRGR